MAEAKKTIVKVRKDAKGNVTHVIYDDGKAETLAQAVKRAAKGGIANYDAVKNPRTGNLYLRKARGETRALADLPAETVEKKSGCRRKKE
ncbi:MAG: hypothetical protein H5T86_10330 [Armatimonadetes bacterium]|nr:hypothetical protein [Armatimonadota bacterium]